MSFSRQDRDVLVRTYGVTLSQGAIVPPSTADWHQLVYAAKGVMTLRTGSGVWVVPPHRASWIPSAMEYDLKVGGPTALRILYLPSRGRHPRIPFDLTQPAVVNVAPLLRELILRAVFIGALQPKISSHRHLAALIWDELERVPISPLQLPYPKEPRASVFVSSVEAGKPEKLALKESGAGRRTLEREFLRETGMSLGRWTRRRRLLTGLQLLASGSTSSEVAFQLGYCSASAFIAMFKRELGATPGQYLDRA